MAASGVPAHYRLGKPVPERRSPGAARKRKQSRVAARLLALSQTYGLASREMSLIAVVTRPATVR